MTTTRDTLARIFGEADGPLTPAQIERHRLWGDRGPRVLHNVLRDAVDEGLVRRVRTGAYELTEVDPGRCAACGDPLAWVGEPGSDRIHAWSGRLGLPERAYDHAAVVAVTR